MLSNSIFNFHSDAKISQCRTKKVLHLGTDWISPFLAWVLPQEESQQFHGDQRLQQNGVEYYHHHQEVWQGIWSLCDQTGARIEEIMHIWGYKHV